MLGTFELDAHGHSALAIISIRRPCGSGIAKVDPAAVTEGRFFFAEINAATLNYILKTNVETSFQSPGLLIL